MTPELAELTIFFIVEPPAYQNMACYLAASIRRHLGAEVQLVGCCPRERRTELSAAALLTLDRLGCELREFEAAGRFEPPYPHGNKLLASAEPRQTRWSCFMDSDILLLNAETPFAEFMQSGAVCASAAASLLWADDALWPPLYRALGLELPAQDFRYMRDRRRLHYPYYSAGFVLFPERLPDGRHFGRHWLEVARRLDGIEALPGRRPYLDQIALPLAIASAGVGFQQIPERHHYILGGKLRGKPFPQDAGISLVHYRGWRRLKEAGLAEHAKRALRRTAGARSVGRVHRRFGPQSIAESEAAAPADGAG